MILSLVYVGGTILASKRAPYADLIASGFSDEVLAERLKRQHRLICAAINSGRIDDLKKMSGRPKGAPQKKEEELPEAVTVEEEVASEVETAPAASSESTVEEPFEIEYWPVAQEWVPPSSLPEDIAEVFEPGMEPRYEPVDLTAAPPPPAEEVIEEELQPEEEFVEPVLEDGLYLTLLDDDEFYSGQRYTLRVQVNNLTNGDEKPL